MVEESKVEQPSINDTPFADKTTDENTNPTQSSQLRFLFQDGGFNW